MSCKQAWHRIQRHLVYACWKFYIIEKSLSRVKHAFRADQMYQLHTHIASFAPGHNNQCKSILKWHMQCGVYRMKGMSHSSGRKQSRHPMYYILLQSWKHCPQLLVTSLMSFTLCFSWIEGYLLLLSFLVCDSSLVRSVSLSDLFFLFQ